MPTVSVSYSIKAMAVQTGLTVHTIRAWERRYGALDPERTATNRRSYSSEDLNRLKLLERAVRAGHSIGRISSLRNEELQEIAGSPMRTDYSGPTGQGFVGAAQRAIMEMDATALEEALARGSAEMGLIRMLDEVVVPIMEFLDRGWDVGQVTISMEHIASATIRGFLDRTCRELSARSHGPTVAVTTPAGQHHELGALIVALRCTLAGCRVVYLGPNLPAEEIAIAAKALGAVAIAISIVHPADDPLVEVEIAKLVQLAGPNCRGWVGGRAAPAYLRAIESSGAKLISDLQELRSAIERIN